MLVFARLAFLFGLVVLELSVVQQPADGRDGGGRNLNEVQFAFSGDVQGLLNGQRPKLDTFVIDDEDLSGADAVVDSEFSGYRKLPS